MKETFNVSVVKNGSLSLFINGYRQFSSLDEVIYHETFCCSGVKALGRKPKRVLILGGGDGLLAREVLKFEPEKVDLVDISKPIVELCKKDPDISKLNQGALERVNMFIQDADRFLRKAHPGKYDIVFADYPDPSNPTFALLYEQEHLALINKVLRRKEYAVFVQQIGAGYLFPHMLKRYLINVKQQGFENASLVTIHGVTFGLNCFVVSTNGEQQHKDNALFDGIPLSYFEPDRMPFPVPKWYLSFMKDADVKEQGIFDCWLRDSITLKELL